MALVCIFLMTNDVEHLFMCLFAIDISSFDILKSFPNFVLGCLFSFFLSFFLAVLGLRCCTQAFSSCGEQGLLFVAVHRLLIVVASLVAELGL